MTESQAEIVCYGTRQCPDCWRARWFLDQHQTPYKWIDIDKDPEARAYVQQVNGGYRSVPTIVFPDGSILVEPSNAELAERLGLAT